MLSLKIFRTFYYMIFSQKLLKKLTLNLPIRNRKVNLHENFNNLESNTIQYAIKNRRKIMIYFDNSATTVPYPEALRTYQEVATKIFGNPSSLHQLGTSATRILEASRKQVADLIGKSADEIFFTSGGTEGDNWVIKGVAFEKEPYGKHIIVSDIEHPAVKESFRAWFRSVLCTS